MHAKRLQSVLALCLLLLVGKVWAEIDAYPFDDLAQEKRFHTLVQEFRCPKCQNQNLADSNAPLAKDLRDIIYAKVKANESDQAIASFLQERYGDFVLYRPPVKASTMLLWFGPALVLLIAIASAWRWLRRRPAPSNSPLTEQEQARLKALLEGGKPS
ncbi:cytochrome c-type biogenesis protein CcmH [Permianibacter sp. IMCC34836]|nr:cytochrome c-type biogenesis protein CcmH [Permianibacter fluminis]